jgi:hypothetical protein
MGGGSLRNVAYLTWGNKKHEWKMDVIN